MLSKLIPGIVLISFLGACAPEDDLEQQPAGSRESAEPSKPESRATDEAEIQSVYEQILAGWKQASGDAATAPFAADGVFVAADGTVLEGRDEIARFHNQLFAQDPELASRLTGRLAKVRFLGPDAAVALAEGRMVSPEAADEPGVRDSMQVLAVRKQGERWLVELFQFARTVSGEEQQFLDRLGSLPEEAREEVTERIDSLAGEPSRGSGLER